MPETNLKKELFKPTIYTNTLSLAAHMHTHAVKCSYYPIQYSYNIVSCTTHGWTQNQEVVDNTAMATTKRVPHQKPKHITSWLNTLAAHSWGESMQSDDPQLLCRSVIQCQSYKHNYARPNNNCEIADIAQGQKGMRGGMEGIRLSYASGSKIFGRHWSRERDKNDLIWTWRTTWNSKLVKAVFLSSICFTMQLLKQVCLTARSKCVVGLHIVLPATFLCTCTYMHMPWYM